MLLTFIGANHEVTGSCTLLQVGGTNLLIDCGMEQGYNMFENAPLPIPASAVDYVLLTHAHIDHSGLLPLLYKNGFRGRVCATRATCSLCEIMLRDSAHIQESDAEFKNRKARRSGRPVVEPLYSMADAEGLLELMRPFSYQEISTITEHISLRFTDIGHLLGSSCIELWLNENGVEKKIVFSGDVGNTSQPIICDPKTVDGANYLMIESTYGNRYHEEKREKRASYVQTLADFIQTTLDRGGNVIIPSFAVGRTQELLYFIREIKNADMVTGHGNFPVYVDSPLANEATAVFLQCDMDYLDEDTRAVMAGGENPLVFPGLHTNVTTEESRALNTDMQPKVIIASSGMCEAGRIRHHLKYNLWRPESLILFVGYQANGTLGRAIYEGAESVTLFGDEVAVHAQIGFLPGISGHADKGGLLNWINAFTQKPDQVFVNHGDDDACIAFTECLNTEYGYEAAAPYSGSVYDLAAGVWVSKAQPKPVERKAPGEPVRTVKSTGAFGALMAALSRLTEVVRRSEGMPNKELKQLTEQIHRLADQWKR